MRHVFLLLFMLPFLAQSQSQSKRQGTYASVSAGLSQFNTHWYYYRFDGNPGRYNYPDHKISRFLVSAGLEKKSFLQKGAIHFDLAGQLVLGFGGKSRGQWLPDDDVISSGGWAAGINAQFRAAYPLTGNTRITPFIGLGPEFMTLHNNGKGVEGFAQRPYYDYTSGWNEFIIQLAGTAGVDIPLSSFTITPELHFGVIGYSFTDWEPNEDGVEMESSPTKLGFAIRIAKRL